MPSPRARTRAKRARTRFTQADQEMIENLADPIEETNDRTGLVREEIDHLPDSLRRVVELFYFRRMDYEDIAHQTGLTIGAVGQRLSRARRHLRNALTTRRAG